ncbi:MAG: hypothetical protein GY884_31370, partial [Proteobacteria bacterium]|nr:hypothetical protein [Pseudomonadota bacterium]
DDDGDGQLDWYQGGVPEENDWALLTITADQLADAGALRLKVSDNDIRVWSGEKLLVGYQSRTELELYGPFERDIALQIELGSWPTDAVLRLEKLDDDLETLESTDVPVTSSPLLLSHHLQTVEEVFVMEFSSWMDNRAMVDGLHDVLGDKLTVGDGNTYWDQWIQDELEFGNLYSPHERLQVIVNSIRSSRNDPLEQYIEDVLQGSADRIAQTWGDKNPSSQDSFGNMEVSPPVTVGGADYPFGRIYYGEWFGEGPVEEVTDMLADQGLQDPFVLDVSWLCVGHVDEFTSFLPDPTAPKGWRLYVSDTEVGYEFLEGLDPDYELPKFAADHHYGTVGQILDDAALRMLNEDLQQDYIEPSIDLMKAELGLDDADIVRVPSVFEEFQGCWGATLALIPGTVNMLVTPLENGETHLFLPDPFFRQDEGDQSTDPFIEALEELLPASSKTHWLDDWDTYHLLMGEVHCGTNTRRAPMDNWWDATSKTEGE